MAGNEQLGNLARRLQELREGTPEREQLLERLAAEIREGRYQVDADALADKLIDQVFRRGDEK